jgi:hypothetical protein
MRCNKATFHLAHSRGEKEKEEIEIMEATVEKEFFFSSFLFFGTVTGSNEPARVPRSTHEALLILPSRRSLACHSCPSDRAC